MPHIKIRDASGVNYEIISSNPATVAAWLVETFNRLVSADVRVNHPVQVDVWPHFTYTEEGYTADWTPAGSSFTFDADQFTMLHELLTGVYKYPKPPKPPEPESEQLRTHGL